MTMLIESRSHLEKQLAPKNIEVLLASLDCRSENVVVEAIIVPELELRNVKMQVLLAYIVECPDDAAFDDVPEAFK